MCLCKYSILASRYHLNSPYCNHRDSERIKPVIGAGVLLGDLYDVDESSEFKQPFLEMVDEFAHQYSSQQIGNRFHRARFDYS